MIKSLRVAILIFLIELSVTAQYDAHKLEKIYADLFRAEMLSYQLEADMLFLDRGVYPYETKDKLNRDVVFMNALVDSVTVNIPAENEKLFKIHMKWKKSWDILSSMLVSGQNESRKYAQKLFNRFRSQRENLEKEILLFLSFDEPDLALLNRLRDINNGVENIFKEYLLRQNNGKVYKAMEDYAESLLKIRRKYKKNNNISFLTANMIADLKTFGRAIDNGYKPEVIYRSHAKFNNRVFRLFDLIYPTLNK